MTQATSGVTLIPRAPSTLNQAPNPLDTVIHNAGRKLCGLMMTRLVGEADKSDAQALTRDLLDIARIVDEAFHQIGREAKAHFGHGIDLTLFTDQLLGAIEGNATFNLSDTVEARNEEIEGEIDPDYRYKSRRNAA